MTISTFRKVVYAYYRRHARQFPWRQTRDPYRIFVSEIMLQQTQAPRVIEKYNQFIKAFPDFSSLATAPLRKVLQVWQGLGYNRRALQLKRAATIVVTKFRSRLPQSVEELDSLPGVGRATAAAIVAYAFNQPVIYLETNIRTVFIHHFFPQRRRVSDRELLPLIQKTLDRKNPRRWYTALMDYGARLKKRFKNPSRRSKQYVRHEKFEGSRRQVRGRILWLLTSHKALTSISLARTIDRGRGVVKKCLLDLEREGLVTRSGSSWTIT